MLRSKSLLIALGVAASLFAVAPIGAAAQSASETISLTTGDGAVEARIIRRSEMPGAALIVGLHGYGMDAKQIETLVNVEPQADHVFAALQAPVPVDGGGGAWLAGGA